MIYSLEPAWMLKDEAQGYARIRRLGQTRDMFTWRLINQDSVVEPTIVLRQKARANMVNLTYMQQGDSADFGDAPPQDAILLEDDFDPVEINAVQAEAPGMYANENHDNGLSDNDEDYDSGDEV